MSASRWYLRIKIGNLKSWLAVGAGNFSSLTSARHVYFAANGSILRQATQTENVGVDNMLLSELRSCLRRSWPHCTVLQWEKKRMFCETTSEHLIGIFHSSHFDSRKRKGVNKQKWNVWTPCSCYGCNRIRLLFYKHSYILLNCTLLWHITFPLSAESLQEEFSL